MLLIDISLLTVDLFSVSLKSANFVLNIVLDARSFKTHLSIATCLYHLLVYTGTIRQFPFEKLIIVSEFKKLERINLLRYKSKDV